MVFRKINKPYAIVTRILVTRHILDTIQIQAIQLYGHEVNMFGSSSRSWELGMAGSALKLTLNKQSVLFIAFNERNAAQKWIVHTLRHFTYKDTHTRLLTPLAVCWADSVSINAAATESGKQERGSGLLTQVRTPGRN